MNMNEGRRDRATTGEREFFPFFFFYVSFLILSDVTTRTRRLMI